MTKYILLENLFKYNSLSTGHQRVIAKEREEKTQRIKIKSQQYLSLLLYTKLSNKMYIFKSLLWCFIGNGHLHGEFFLNAGAVNSK